MAFPKSAIKGELPKRINRPCDFALSLSVTDLEMQLGTVEAYNRLVEVSERLKARIEKGQAKAQNPIYAVSIKGEQPI